jgi:hypothetical protein
MQAASYAAHSGIHVPGSGALDYSDIRNFEWTGSGGEAE